MNTTKSLLCVAALMLAMTCNAFAAAEPAAPPAAKTPAELRLAISASMKEKRIPGVSYAVFDRNGLVFSDVIGVEDARSKQPVAPETLFRIASITKSVTAIAILQLVEQGHFKLDTPVAELLPTAPINNAWNGSDPVRVVHLLSHTAGFDDTHPNAFYSDVELRGAHLDALLRHPAPLKARWRPGTVHSYSNPGYWVLGAILEAHYRKRWDDIVKQQVLDPLGMKDTLSLTSQALKLRHASGHAGSDMHDTGIAFGTAQADGALWCNALDLAKLGRFLMTNGASAPGVLGASLVRDMKRHQQTLAAAAGLDYGYGVGLQPRTLYGVQWQGHTGGDIGALSSMHFREDAGMGYVLLVNSENALRPMERPIASFITAGAGIEPPAARRAPVSSDVDGWYRATNSRSDLIGILQFLAGVGHASANGDQIKIAALLPGLTMSATLNHHGSGLLADVDDGEVVNGVILRDGAGKVSAIQVGSHYMERTNMVAAVVPTYGLLLAIVLLLSVPFGRRKRLNNPWVRRLPALALLALIGTITCLVNLNAQAAAALNWQTAGILVGTTLLPMLAVGGLVHSARTWRTETAEVAKWRALGGSLGAAWISVLLAAFGWTAMALWAW
jgi:CubicO group peptidase (beta-lactamase class C family)